MINHVKRINDIVIASRVSGVAIQKPYGKV